MSTAVFIPFELPHIAPVVYLWIGVGEWRGRLKGVHARFTWCLGVAVPGVFTFYSACVCDTRCVIEQVDSCRPIS